MRVPRFDPVVADLLLVDAIREAVGRVLQSGCFIGGSEVEALELDLASVLGCPRVVCVGSGTDALTLGLRGILGHRGFGRVVTTALSFSATASAIVRAGLEPVFVDIDPNTLSLDWDAAARVEHACAVIPVHLYGRVCSPPAGWEGPPILEDACQAFGAPGAAKVGDAAAISFFPSKPLGCYGDGGALACSAEVAARVRMLARHGSRVPYVSECAGFNSRLDAIQAAILRVKLPFVKFARKCREEIAHSYDDQLKDLSWVTLPELSDGHAWHCYVLQVDAAIREASLDRLRRAGVEAFVPYPVPLHEMNAFRARNGPCLEHAEAACKRVIGLPIWSGMTRAQVDYVAETLRGS